MTLMKVCLNLKIVYMMLHRAGKGAITIDEARIGNVVGRKCSVRVLMRGVE